MTIFHSISIVTVLCPMKATMLIWIIYYTHYNYVIWNRAVPDLEGWLWVLGCGGRSTTAIPNMLFKMHEVHCASGYMPVIAFFSIIFCHDQLKMYTNISFKWNFVFDLTFKRHWNKSNDLKITTKAEFGLLQWIVVKWRSGWGLKAWIHSPSELSLFCP